MSRVLLINAAEPEETRAALVEAGRLQEYRCERRAADALLGNIYKGVVANVERGIGAAFIDLGVGRNGFLHETAWPRSGPDDARRIGDLCDRGDAVLVQVTRESIGSKGPVLTGDLSLPGRFLVLLPFSQGGGISRRIGEDGDRAKLRALGRELEAHAAGALIVRTAAADRTKRELLRDLKMLERVWASVKAKAARRSAPSLLYREGDLVARALRDLVQEDVAEVVVDTPEAFARAEEAVEAIQPELRERLRLYTEAMPLFHAHGLEEQIDGLRVRHVPLPGGGSIVFDRTEALVAVDVNSGRMREEEGLEETALKTNLEAAGAIARQLRLRDLGGVIVVDFIDMRETAHTRQVERAFKEALRSDRSRLRAGRLGPFGIFALTRRRRTAGGLAARRPCPRCAGTGEVVRPEETALRVFRELQARAASGAGRGLRARVNPEVGELLSSTRGRLLKALSEEAGVPVGVETDPALPPERWVVDAV